MASAKAEVGASRRAVTVFFDDGAAAQAAVDDLVAAGVARERITLVEGEARPVAAEAVPTSGKGLWDTVEDLFMADEDRHAYGEGLRRGGVLLSVTSAAADHDRVVEILDREGAVDLAAARDLSRSAPDAAPASRMQAAVAPMDGPRSVFEPSVPVGRAFAAGEAGRGSGRVVGRSVVRDGETEGLRLRTYVESPARSDPAG